MTSTTTRVRELQEAGEDFEWYPTTDEIIAAVCNDMESERYQYARWDSLMDIGAGDGRVLIAINEKRGPHDKFSELWAIEKATPHLQAMPKQITVIGCEFMEQNLLDKQADVTFCNPPYREFKRWMMKILAECVSKTIYLAVPRRWRDDKDIETAIDTRGSNAEILGEFDFENAERQARAKVDLVRIDGKRRNLFEAVVEQLIPDLDKFDCPEIEEKPQETTGELADGCENIVQHMVKGYQQATRRMIGNYRAACQIDARVLKQLGIEKDSIVTGIREGVKGLKDKYWKELFEVMQDVTRRLATKQRKEFLQELQSKVTVDFTEKNVYAFLIWVSKHANDHYDDQLIELFRTLSNDSNVVKYKSNQRTWSQGDWYYCSDDERNQASHYRLEYRMVVSHGGVCDSEWSYERDRHKGLTERAFNLLRDIVTVANNLHFPCDDSPGNYEWKSNKQNRLMMKDGRELVAVRAFKNGNMHFHFHPEFMLAVNVEAGRLLGWLRDKGHTADEFEATAVEAEQIAERFGSSFRIGRDAGLKIEFNESAS